MRFIFAIATCLFVSSAEANYLLPDTATVKVATVTPAVKKSQAKKHIPLPRVLKSLVKLEVDEDDNYWNEPMIAQVPYRRPELVSNTELPLSDYVTLRLAHARRLALNEYRQIWG
jgi:hypothetical protein